MLFVFFKFILPALSLLFVCWVIVEECFAEDCKEEDILDDT